MSLEEKLDKVTSLLEHTITLLEMMIQKMEEREPILEQSRAYLGSIGQLFGGIMPTRSNAIEETPFD